MENWLNYHHLFYFKTIADEGSIAKAAAKLRLGQPTLSAQLKQFEERIGVQLFERHHRKLVLTESGRIALDYASEIFRTGSEMVEVLHDRLVPLRTNVQLGALDSIPKQISFKLIEGAYAIAPCSVSLLEGRDDELLRLLLGHKIDLMLTNHLPSVTDGKRVRVRSLGKLPVVICGAPKFKSLKKGFPSSIDKERFVMPTVHSKFRHELEHYFRTHSIFPDVIGEAQDTRVLEVMGARGVGLIAAPAVSVEPMLKSGELVSLGVLEGIHEEIFLVSASRKIENPIAASLLKQFSLK